MAASTSAALVSVTELLPWTAPSPSGRHPLQLATLDDGTLAVQVWTWMDGRSTYAIAGSCSADSMPRIGVKGVRVTRPTVDYSVAEIAVTGDSTLARVVAKAEADAPSLSFWVPVFVVLPPAPLAAASGPATVEHSGEQIGIAKALAMVARRGPQDAPSKNRAQVSSGRARRVGAPCGASSQAPSSPSAARIAAPC